MLEKVLYHGSQTSGITLLEPQLHRVGQDRKVVFATNDANYALAMVYGTGDDLAVSYALNSETGKKEMYVDELQPNKLKLLEDEGYLYEVDAKYFEPSPERLEGEYASYSSVPVISEKKLENIAEALKEQGVCLVDYDHVLESMDKRQKLSSDLNIKHRSDRFRN